MEYEGTNFLPMISDQPVVAFLGLKRKHWPMRNHFEAIANQWLENMGIMAKVECFKKVGGNTPYLNPNNINLFLRLEGRGDTVNFY